MSKAKDTDQLWSPALRRPRKQWKNDRDLIEKFTDEVKSNSQSYPEQSKSVVAFLQIVNELKNVGYEKSEKTAPLAEWILQKKRELEGQQSSSATDNAFIEIPNFNFKSPTFES